MNDFDNEKFSSLLKTAIGSSRTITEFSKNCGVARPYISKFLNLKLDTAPSPDVISKFANNARNGVTEDDLSVAAGYIEDPVNQWLKEMNPSLTDTERDNLIVDKRNQANIMYDNNKEILPPIKVPVLSHIDDTEGFKSDNDENVSYWSYVTSHETKGVENSFYLSVEDNSMSNTKILEGDLVYVLPQDYGNNGDIVVVIINGETYIRRFNKINNIIMFQAENAEFDSFAYPNSEFKSSEIKIIGKVSYLHSNLNLK
ncbi:hypothetical protein KPL37_18290 [Clostridium frigoris]|uniref:Peptidase S24/S26A/S26B/S26C domain-containing protein n=1 Tax=Clostridium frigoris TaxID=205327 RepID=A0ABS6BYJ0_9CLOT|nr:S24 family peptidase [Clostridium frigoris]MBU3161650.1 hypothetical protein [Clostridium frigoris]